MITLYLKRLDLLKRQIDRSDKPVLGLSISFLAHALLLCLLALVAVRPRLPAQPPLFVEVKTTAVISAPEDRPVAVSSLAPAPPALPKSQSAPILAEPNKLDKPKSRLKPPIARPRIEQAKPSPSDASSRSYAQTPPIAFDSGQTPSPPPTAVPDNAQAAASETVVEADFRSPMLKNPPTIYPPEALNDALEGTVKLKVQVFANGLPGQIRIAHSSGYSILDESAAKQLVNWRFIPARRGGVAIDSWVIVPIKFELSP